MQIGFGIPVSGSWATPANIVEVSRKAESLGYSTLWSFQRTVFPADDSIPAPYRSVHDPLAISAYAAAVTERIRIGIAIVNLPFYAPIVLAKALTSIDVLSDGRLDAGLGLGWNPDEFAAAGVPMERRGARAEDFIACLRAIWSPEENVEHHGEFYDMPRGKVDPKPVQQPHPPILLGGSAETALQRAGRLADGWISASRFEAAKVPSAIETIRTAARAAGRDPADLRVVIRGSVKVRETDEDTPLTGTIDKIKQDMTAYAEAGATELFVDLNFDEQIGNPDADPAESMRRAHAALEAFAPGS
ncbi:MAG TPA: TIGR03619 family F420-dependent LLM class oxidoreductase [Mycobacteriales bacterium]|jgi:probable F420-dependent oxidoreductase|nr:TIGR03619 family F420-dependent LLM class oxidoreductase [Mycobacteriales bacterium]